MPKVELSATLHDRLNAIATTTMTVEMLVNRAQRLGLYFPSFGWRRFRRLNITGLQPGPNAVNVFEAMAEAGHTKPETTMKYTLLQSAGRQKAIADMQERWLPKNCAGIVRSESEAEVA